MGVRTVGRRFLSTGLDVRLVIGVALVAASLAGVWAVVAAADRSVPVYAAASTIVAGDRIGPDDLVVRRVSLGEAHALYLAPVGTSAGPPDGAVATRTVRVGELVPLDAVGRAGDVARAPVVVPVAGELAGSVAEGEAVDVWSTPPADAEDADPPSILVAGAVVTRIVEEDALVSSAASASVELSVPDGSVAVLLAAKAAGSVLELVPVAAGDAG